MRGCQLPEERVDSQRYFRGSSRSQERWRGRSSRGRPAARAAWAPANRPATHLVIGAGDQPFSAGQDLTEAKDMDGPVAEEWVREYERLYDDYGDADGVGDDLTKFQVAIRKAIRERLGLAPGQKVRVTAMRPPGAAVFARCRPRHP